MRQNVIRIHLSKLLSPKPRIEFRERADQIPGDSFFELLQAFRQGVKVAPIEVTPRGVEFVILNGVHRALAALVVGCHDIEAVLVAGRLTGPAIPLRNVLFPHDLRTAKHD